ncbi:unnamed protein product [marine sediment metagenome]|uniref:Uncharacterized protein n=1 Tax=marine sediment metagenome TaxID=412755 RepID=X0RFP5_9ZZZZ
MKNKSGIYPAGNRVLVFVDQIEDGLKTKLIEIPEAVREKYQSANASGALIECGPDAFLHMVECVYSPKGEALETRVKGYSEPFAEAGDRISFAKHAGYKYLGKDGKKYLVMLDEDITCKIDDEVELTDLNLRKGVGL